LSTAALEHRRPGQETQNSLPSGSAMVNQFG